MLRRWLGSRLILIIRYYVTITSFLGGGDLLLSHLLSYSAHVRVALVFIFLYGVCTIFTINCHRTDRYVAHAYDEKET